MTPASSILAHPTCPSHLALGDRVKIPASYYVEWLGLKAENVLITSFSQVKLNLTPAENYQKGPEHTPDVHTSVSTSMITVLYCSETLCLPIPHQVRPSPQ